MGGIKRQIIQKERAKKTSWQLLFFHVSGDHRGVTIQRPKFISQCLQYSASCASVSFPTFFPKGVRVKPLGEGGAGFPTTFPMQPGLTWKVAWIFSGRGEGAPQAWLLL